MKYFLVKWRVRTTARPRPRQAAARRWPGRRDRAPLRCCRRGRLPDLFDRSRSAQPADGQGQGVPEPVRPGPAEQLAGDQARDQRAPDRPGRRIPVRRVTRAVHSPSALTAWTRWPVATAAAAAPSRISAAPRPGSAELVSATTRSGPWLTACRSSSPPASRMTGNPRPRPRRSPACRRSRVAARQAGCRTAPRPRRRPAGSGSPPRTGRAPRW